MLSTRHPPQNKGHIQTKSEGLEKDIPHKQRPKESRSSNTHIRKKKKKDFEIKTIKRDKEGHYIVIKGSIQEEDITIVNIYASNIGALQYVRQMLTSYERGINRNRIIMGDFNIPLTPMHRSNKQKISKETQV